MQNKKNFKTKNNKRKFRSFKYYSSLKQTVSYIKTLWEEQKFRIVFLLILSLTNTALSIIYPVIIKNVIDALAGLTSQSQLFKYSFYILSIAVSTALVYSTLQINRVFVNTSYLWKLTLFIFKFILTGSRKFFEKFNHGDLMTRIGMDIDIISWVSCSGIFRFFDATSLIIFSLIMMSSFSLKLTLYLFVPVSALVFLTVIFDKNWDKAYNELQENVSEVNDTIEKVFNFIKVVKSNNMENFSDYEFEKVMRKRRKSELKITKFNSFWHSSDYFINYTGILIILYFGGKMVINDKLTIGIFVAFMYYLYIMLEHLYTFAYFFVNLRRSSVSIKRHIEILSFESNIEKPEKFLSLNFIKKKYKTVDYSSVYNFYRSKGKDDNIKKISIEEIKTIKFENVYFSINGNQILKNVTFEIKKGEFIGLTGPVGSGKSICMELLVGLETPEKGKILINNININEIEIDSLRNLIGYVFQEPILFSGSIEENIMMKAPANFDPIKEYLKRKFLKVIYTKYQHELNHNYYNNFKKSKNLKYNDKELLKAIEIASLKSDIDSFTEGIRTLVGPKGMMVSGGQRERITIARAIYKNPSLYIFDDSTRSLDSETEKRVVKNIKSLKKDSTIILITQRLPSIYDADKIIVFNAGTVVAEGKHNYLYKTCKIYKELCDSKIE